MKNRLETEHQRAKEKLGPLAVWYIETLTQEKKPIELGTLDGAWSAQDETALMYLATRPTSTPLQLLGIVRRVVTQGLWWYIGALACLNSNHSENSLYLILTHEEEWFKNRRGEAEKPVGLSKEEYKQLSYSKKQQAWNQHWVREAVFKSEAWPIIALAVPDRFYQMVEKYPAILDWV